MAITPAPVLIASLIRTSPRLSLPILSFHGPPLPHGARVLDAFAGTGALGLEAPSRGAGFVTFMDASPQAMKAVADNLRAMKG